ncbi:hypothetical protein AgCh_026192 [Apium graveolens]
MSTANMILTLCFWYCLLPVPLGLPNLEFLRKLEIQGTARVQLLPNTISGLPNLEELHIPNGFKIQDDGSDKISDAVSLSILAEINRFIGLKSLQMTFRDTETFRDTNIFYNLLEYDIRVSNDDTRYQHLLYSSVSIKRSVRLNINQLEGLESLIERAEEVSLENTDIDMGSVWNSNRRAFSDLRYLYLYQCNTIEFIARISRDEIHSSFQLLTSFSKLIILEIIKCSSIKSLFSKSVAKGLVQLQKLTIRWCPEIEAIVMNEDKNDVDIINFSKLKSLWLDNSPRLKSFYREKEDMHAFPWVQSQQPFFNEMVSFPSMEVFIASELKDTASDIWGKHYCSDVNVSSFCKLKSLSLYYCNQLETTVIPPAMLSRMRDLETIRIRHCNTLKNVFPPCIARDLIHLKELDVTNCELLREIIGVDEQETTDGIVFPELTDLCLDKLPNMTSFWCYQTGEVFRSLQQLQLLNIHDSTILEEIVEDVRGGEASDMDKKTIKLLQLKSFTLTDLPNIRSIIINSNYKCRMPALTKVKVANCGVSTLFTFSALRSLPQLQELQILNCSKLEEILEGVRGDEASGMDKKTIRLLHLRSLILIDLPNLESLISSVNYECRMPALTMVKIDNCGLSTLFTCSVSRKLRQLASLDVSNCSSLKSIVDDVGNDKASLTDNTFKLCFHEKVWEHIPDLNNYIRKNCKRGSNSSDIVKKLSSSAQQLEAEIERVEEEQAEEGY